MCVMPFSFYFNLNYFICNILWNEGEEKRQRWKQIHKLCQHSFLFFWLFKILELNKKKTQRERRRGNEIYARVYYDHCQSLNCI